MTVRRKHALVKVVSGLALVLALMAFHTACSKRQVTGAKGQVGEPTAGGTGGETLGAEIPTPIDPEVIQGEIQRRREVLGATRERYNQLPAGLERDTAAMWIHALKEQIEYLEEIQVQLQTWPTMGPSAEQAQMAQKVASRLMDCIVAVPMEPPGASLSLGSGTLMSWESVRLAYEKGDCTEALEQYEASAQTVPEEMVPADVQVLRALCLSRFGRYSEAIQTLEPVLKTRGQLMDAQYLHYLLANWLFQESLLDQAGASYQSVLDGARERDRWEELAKIRLDQIRLQRGELPLAQMDQTLSGPESEPSLAGAPSWSDQSEEITRFGEPDSTDKPPRDIQLESTVSSVEASVPSIHDVRDARLVEAQQFMENEQYEEAITAYQVLLGTEYDTIAQEGIQQAQDLYAETSRREAASLVLKAHGESDPESRKALLIQALRLLQDINARYPGNKYGAKVQQNIRDVVEQIQGLEPGFEPYASSGVFSRGTGDPQTGGPPQ